MEAEGGGVGEREVLVCASNDSKQIDKCLINSLAHGFTGCCFISLCCAALLFRRELALASKKKTFFSPSLPCQYFIFQSVSLHHVARAVCVCPPSLPPRESALVVDFYFIFPLVHLMTRHYTHSEESRVD